MMVCKHGLPITYDIKPKDYQSEDTSYRMVLTISMCKTCIDDGVAAALAKVFEEQARKMSHAFSECQPCA